MNDETAAGSAGTPQGQGHPGGGVGQQSPLQARAQFLKNRSWELIIGLNQGACARGGAQHGFNRETQAACASDWSAKQEQTLSLAETIEFLRQVPSPRPVPFFNGNHFRRCGTSDCRSPVCRFAYGPTPRGDVRHRPSHCGRARPGAHGGDCRKPLRLSRPSPRCSGQNFARLDSRDHCGNPAGRPGSLAAAGKNC